MGIKKISTNVLLIIYNNLQKGGGILGTATNPDCNQFNEYHTPIPLY